METKVLISQENSKKLEQAYLHPLSSEKEASILIPSFITIGRESNNKLQVQGEFISRYHARIEKMLNGRFYIKDLNSQNGVYVNNCRVFEAPLNDGDHIRIGDKDYIFGQILNQYNESLLQSNNKQMQFILKSLSSFAKSNLPCIITGESGTGKELYAQQLHQMSPRHLKPLISINCGALSSNLIESELFGHTKGSFTDAQSDRKGAFECARGGTLFLDEVGDLPLELQPKLLRAIENMEIRPVGSDKTIKTDVRIITATHKDLQKEVQEGRFRLDLYYRLNVIKIELPNLKDRSEDFDHILKELCFTYKVHFTSECLLALKSVPWPGNIRQLKNFVARCSALFPHRRIELEMVQSILEENYCQESKRTQKDLSIKDPHMNPIKVMEKNIIYEKLIKNRGNQRLTARELGMAKSTLHDKIKSYKIDVNKISSDAKFLRGSENINTKYN